MHIKYASRMALFATVLTATPSLAQVCEGRPGPGAGRVQLGAGLAVGNGAQELAVSITGLGERAYGSAAFGSVSFKDFTGTATNIGASVGYQLAVGASGRAQLCPFISGGLGFGPNDIRGSGVDDPTDSDTFGQLSIGLGLMFGQQFAARPAVTIPLDLRDAEAVFEVTIGLALGSLR